MNHSHLSYLVSNKKSINESVIITLKAENVESFTVNKKKVFWSMVYIVFNLK